MKKLVTTTEVEGAGLLSLLGERVLLIAPIISTQGN